MPIKLENVGIAVRDLEAAIAWLRCRAPHPLLGGCAGEPRTVLEAVPHSNRCDGPHLRFLRRAADRSRAPRNGTTLRSATQFRQMMPSPRSFSRVARAPTASNELSAVT